MIKPIVTERKELTSVCAPVCLGSEHDKAAIRDLGDTVRSLENCAGLAAPQIGHKIRAIVVDTQGNFLIMLNPSYIKKSGKLSFGNEGCLSRPDTVNNPVKVKRYYRVAVRYIDVSGETVTKNFKNFIARVVQHEIDHLNGILI